MRVHQVLDKCWFSSNPFTFTVYFETCSFAPQCMFLPDEYDAIASVQWTNKMTNFFIDFCHHQFDLEHLQADEVGNLMERLLLRMPEVSPPASAGAGHDKRWLLSSGVSKWRGAEVAASSREAVQAAGGCRESGCWSAPDGLLRRQLANWRRLRHLASPDAAISGHQLCSLNITWEYFSSQWLCFLYPDRHGKSISLTLSTNTCLPRERISLKTPGISIKCLNLA